MSVPESGVPRVVPRGETISYGDFAAMLRRPGWRGILMARHAQRPPIDPKDPTFGGALHITEAGRAQAVAAGRLLRGVEDVAFWAAPMPRTRETAQAVGEGMGAAARDEEIPVSDSREVGTSGLFTRDLRRVHDEYERAGSAAVATDAYFRDGVFPGYAPLKEGAEAMARWMVTKDFGARNVVIASHDIFIAAFLAGLGARTFSSREWVGFLQAAAVVGDASGAWSAYYCVPDPARAANTFFQ